MRTLAAVLAAMALITAGAEAQQRSVAEELRLNMHAAGVHLGRGGEDNAVAPGFSIGYGASRWFMPYFSYDRTSLNDGELDYDLRHMDAGVRVHFRGAEAALVPFALAAFTWRAAEYDDRLFLGEVNDIRVTGTNGTIGAGVLFYPWRRLAVESSAEWTSGDMDQVTVKGLHVKAGEERIDAPSLRLRVGMSWFPVGPRRR